MSADAMTDAELADYLGASDHPDKEQLARFIASLAPEKRAAYERMAQVEFELKLWQAGIGPKPRGVIVCRVPEVAHAENG